MLSPHCIWNSSSAWKFPDFTPRFIFSRVGEPSVARVGEPSVFLKPCVLKWSTFTILLLSWKFIIGSGPISIFQKTVDGCIDLREWATRDCISMSMTLIFTYSWMITPYIMFYTFDFFNPNENSSVRLLLFILLCLVDKIRLQWNLDLRTLVGINVKCPE